MKKWTIVLLALLMLGVFATASAAPDAGKKLRIGVVVAPPFSSYTNGHYKGFVIALWNRVADRSNLNYQYINAGNSAQKAITALEAGKYDALVGPITVTSKRLKRVVFSRPFYMNRLSAATLKTSGGFWSLIWNMIKRFFAWSMLVYFILILVYSLIHWALERFHGVEEYKGGFIKSYFFALWIGIFAFLTGGYERSVESVLARILMIFWMLLSLIFASQLIATITSAVTISSADSLGSSSDEVIRSLYNRKVAAQKDSYAADVAERLGANLTPTEDFKEAFKLLREKKVNIVLGNYLPLRYFIQKSPNINYTPDSVNVGSNEMAFAFPKGSTLRDKVNISLSHLQDDNLAYGICRTYLDIEDSQECVI